jgi:hypothetical protein
MEAFKNAIMEEIANAKMRTGLIDQIQMIMLEKQFLSPKDKMLSTEAVVRMGNTLAKVADLSGKLDVMYSYTVQGRFDNNICGDLAFDLVDQFYKKKVVRQEVKAPAVSVKREARGDGGCPADDDGEVVIIEDKDTTVPDARAALKQARVKAEARTKECFEAGKKLAVAKRTIAELEEQLVKARVDESEATATHNQALAAEHKALEEVGEARMAFDTARSARDGKDDAAKRAKH